MLRTISSRASKHLKGSWHLRPAGEVPAQMGTPRCPCACLSLSASLSVSPHPHPPARLTCRTCSPSFVDIRREPSSALPPTAQAPNTGCESSAL